MDTTTLRTLIGPAKSYSPYSCALVEIADLLDAHAADQGHRRKDQPEPGEDWICGECGYPNDAKDKTCVSSACTDQPESPNDFSISTEVPRELWRLTADNNLLVNLDWINAARQDPPEEPTCDNCGFLKCICIPGPLDGPAPSAEEPYPDECVCRQERGEECQHCHPAPSAEADEEWQSIAEGRLSEISQLHLHIVDASAEIARYRNGADADKLTIADLRAEVETAGRERNDAIRASIKDQGTANEQRQRAEQAEATMQRLKEYHQVAKANAVYEREDDLLRRLEQAEAAVTQARGDVAATRQGYKERLAQAESERDTVMEDAVMLRARIERLVAAQGSRAEDELRRQLKGGE